MQDQHASKMVSAASPVALGVAVVAFALALYSGSIALLPGIALRAVALLLLAGGIVVYTTMRLGPVGVSARLGARAQAVQRRYRGLVWTTIFLVFLVSQAGALVTDMGALWSCQSLPLCTPANAPAVWH